MGVPAETVAGELADTEDFDRVVVLSREMLERARAGEWQSVIDLEGRRQALMSRFFCPAPPPDQLQRLADRIREVLDLDREVMELGRQGMQDLSHQLDQIGAGRKAVRAYAANER